MEKLTPNLPLLPFEVWRQLINNKAALIGRYQSLEAAQAIATEAAAATTKPGWWFFITKLEVVEGFVPIIIPTRVEKVDFRPITAERGEGL